MKRSVFLKLMMVSASSCKRRRFLSTGVFLEPDEGLATIFPKIQAIRARKKLALAGPRQSPRPRASRPASSSMALGKLPGAAAYYASANRGGGAPSPWLV